MPHNDADFFGSKSSDISQNTKYLSKMLIAPPSSPQTPEKKCRSPKRSFEKSPSPSQISKLKAESLRCLGISFDLAEEEKEARNIPSPPKRQRMIWHVVERETDNKLEITGDKPKARESLLSRRARQTLEGNRRPKLAIRKKEELDVIATTPLRSIAGETCCENDSAAENRGMNQVTGKVEVKLLSSLTEESREGKETKDDLPVLVKLCRGLEEPQVSPKIEQMRSSSGFDNHSTTLEIDLFGGNENMVKGIEFVSRGPENNRPIAQEKEDSETYLKFLELFYSQKETGTKKEIEELALIIESVKRMFMSGKLDRQLRKIDDRKTRDEMYLKALESLGEKTGTEPNKRTEDMRLMIEIFKSIRSGQLAKDLQTLREIFEACRKGLDRLIREAEEAYARKNQEEQPSSPTSSRVSASSKNDCQDGVPLAKEYEAITTNDIQDKNVGGVESIGNSSEKILREPVWGAMKSRWGEDFPLPADFDDEAAMLQQAFIQSNYDEFIRLKGYRDTSCSTASANDIISKKHNIITIESSEKVNEENNEDISPEYQQDADDENSDTSESESAHYSAYISDEETEIGTKETSEIGNLTEMKDISVASIECVIKDLLIATAEQLKQDFTSMFQKKCCESTGKGSDNSMDEMFIATTVAVVRRSFQFLKLDAFGEALKKATEEVLAEEKVKERRCATSSESTASIEQKIFKKWAIAYPEAIPIRSFEFMRAIDILISLTRSTPYNHAILEDTPECMYDALVVYIQYYLDTCTNRKCIEIVEGHSLDQQIQWIREMHSFVYWWKEVSEEFKGIWGKGVLNEEVLKNFDVYGGNWNEDEAGRD
ncbi:uncharacterized protein Bfra_007502 [Botrytis fragariae]|uniref:Uncharacterized protein n=1 Tax=Botrytis fragariae TaxID=1964551 RepID=A0A8H6EDV5_9HELO|nr:uncharacterized protein Bfra_007502 [Botrytis fragariae]KAF5868305.1 hypothetical protein Bfra_007502 [Botrytis fragariae]